VPHSFLFSTLLTLSAQARFFGSPHHTINPFKAAIAAIHLILVPLAFISNDDPVRYGARTNWWGNEFVSTSPVKEWVSHRAEGAGLVQRCDALYSEMKKAETTSTDA
jgi:3-keto steroid reductase